MRFWTVFALTTGLLAASPAWAQAQKPRDDASLAEARQRYNEGLKLADESNHEAARLKFSQAWILLKSPAILFNLARSEQLSGHLVEALEHYRQFAKLPTDAKVTEQQKQRASENVAQLAQKVGQISIDAPATARVTIDGKAVDWAPDSDPIAVLPGKHDVMATVDGKATTLTVECTAGTVTPASFAAAATGPAPAPAPPAPTHETKAESAHGFWTSGRAVGAGLVGVGAAGVALGIVFQLKANSAAQDIDDIKAPLPEKDSYCSAKPVPEARMQTCNDLHTKADDVKSAETLRTVFLISGGAVLVGGAALFLLSPPRKTAESSRGLRFVPIASGTEVGIGTFGQF